MARRLRRALPGRDLRVRPDQLDARRRLPLRPRRLRRRRHRRHDVATSASSSTASRARRRSRSRSAACARTSACRTCSRSGSAAARTSTATEVGPQSVGYELTSRALVFGGDELTATDLAVAAGLAEIGDPARVAGLDAGPALARDRGADRGDRRSHEDERGSDSRSSSSAAARSCSATRCRARASS